MQWRRRPRTTFEVTQQPAGSQAPARRTSPGSFSRSSVPPSIGSACSIWKRSTRPRNGRNWRFDSTAVLRHPDSTSGSQGEPLDIPSLLYTAAGRPRISIISIAHLGDAERMLVVSMVLNATLEWTRRQTGTTSLRALVYMDEVFGYLPPVSNPPSKLPLLTLLKQARAFGVGLVLATQNPVDLDYKALSNAGTWFLGKLQTERDKARVLDGHRRPGLDDRIVRRSTRLFRPAAAGIRDAQRPRATASRLRDSLDAVLSSRADEPRRAHARSRRIDCSAAGYEHRRSHGGAPGSLPWLEGHAFRRRIRWSDAEPSA